MKDKELKIKVDDQFIEKVDYLQRINDYKNRSDTVRKVVEKEWRKEGGIDWRPFRDWHDAPEGGSVFVAVTNCFGQHFVVEAYWIVSLNGKVGWWTNDINYAENWKEGDFRLSHNWKVIAWMPKMIPYKEKEKDDGR